MTATTLLARPTTSAHGLNRLTQTSLFRDTEAYRRWLQSSLLIGGAGMLGTPLACEAVRAGIRVKVGGRRPDHRRGQDRARPMRRCGRSKAVALAAACDAINPGRAEALHADLRHVGIGVFAASTMIIDATDDPTLAGYLTTNFQRPWGGPADAGGGGRLGSVQLRAGVDLARWRRPRLPDVRWELKHIMKSLPRTPCPGAADLPPPTIATNATTTAVAGLALHYIMRLVAGNPQVFDRETILDLDNMTIFEQRLVRSPQCISRHRSWAWEQVEARARTAARCAAPSPC